MIRGPFVVTQEDREPYGLACLDCDRPLLEGELYVERLEGMIGETPAVEVVCPPCGEIE